MKNIAQWFWNEWSKEGCCWSCVAITISFAAIIIWIGT